MRIGFVTDEISEDIHEALETGRSWGIQDYEIRVIQGRRVPDIAPDMLRVLIDQQAAHGIRYTALSPGIFKTPLAERKKLTHELEMVLPRTLEMAEQLHTPLVIVFGFQKSKSEPPDNRERAKEILWRAAEKAASHGLTLAVENEPGFWCDTGSQTAAILQEINHPNLRANWDPANAYGTQETPYPDGYHRLKPYIANMHIKDTPTSAHEICVPVGEGKVDWEGQLQAVVRDHLLDLVVIETHCLPLKENSLKNLRKVRELIHRAEHS